MMNPNRDEIAAVQAALAAYDATDRDVRLRRGMPVPLIRQLLNVCKIELPVRFLHADIPEQPEPAEPPQPQVTINDDTVHEVGPGIYFVDAVVDAGSRGGKKQKRGTYKVELVEHHGREADWTCNCRHWQRTRRKCKHIRDVMRVLGIHFDPYATARRRPPTKWIFTEGTISEETRRTHARAEWPKRVPELFVELLHMHVAEKPRSCREDGKPLGAIGTPRKVVVWCLFRKLFRATDYMTTRTDLEGDLALLHQLGWRKTKTPPSIGTICRRLDDAALANCTAEMVPTTGWVGRYYATSGMIDSEEMATAIILNSRDQKTGIAPAPYRSKGAMIERHHLSDVATGLVGAIDVTLDRGLGSADAPHLPGLAERAKTGPFPDMENLSGDGSYGPNRNFEACQRLGVKLFVYSKVNEQRQNPRYGWCELAQEMGRLEHENPAAFHEIRRMRNKGEGLGSRRVRSQGPLRLRRRKHQLDAAYPPEALALFGDIDEPIGQVGELKRDRIKAMGKRISDLPEPLIAAILRAATDAVGPARLIETYLATTILNLKTIVEWEHLTGDGSRPDRVSFLRQKPLRYVPEAREADVRTQLRLIVESLQSADTPGSDPNSNTRS